ncbi:MAG: hypothetical protein QXN17_08330, partial [Nitrososphaerota archaeon]
ILPYIQTQVGAAGQIFSLASGGVIPLWLGALITYIAVTAYIWVGGFRAVTIVDTIQGLILLVSLWVGSLAIIIGFGGLGAFQKLPAQLTYVSGFAGYNWLLTSTWAISYGAGWAFMPHLWINLYSPKNERVARLWPTTVYVENVLHGTVLTIATVMVAAALPGIKPDLAFFAGVQKISQYIYAFVLAGVGAAIVTTVDAQLFVVGLLLSHDILEKGRKHFTDRQFIWINRVLVGVVAIIGFLLYFIYPYPLGIIAGYAAALGLIMAPPVILILTGQKWITKEGVVAGILAGLISIIVFSSTPLTNLFGIHYSAWSVVIDSAVLIVTSLFTKSKPLSETVNEIKAAGW